MAPAAGRKSASRKSASRAGASATSSPNWVRRDAGDGRPFYLNLNGRGLSARLAPMLADEDLEQLVSIDKPAELLSAAERARRAGRWVWVPHKSEVWQFAKEVGKGADGAVTVQPEQGSSAVVPASGALAAGHALCGAEARSVKMPLWDVSWSTIEWV